MEGASLNCNCAYMQAVSSVLAEELLDGHFLPPSTFVILTESSCLREQKWNVQTSTQRSVGNVTPLTDDLVTYGMTNRPQVCESGDLVCATEALLTAFPQTTVSFRIDNDGIWLGFVCVSVFPLWLFFKINMAWMFKRKYLNWIQKNVWETLWHFCKSITFNYAYIFTTVL